jgi:hypothetical protein
MTNTPNEIDARFRQCFGCNYEAVTGDGLCPRCGRKAFFTAKSIKRRGIVVTLCGLSIAGLMGAVTIGVLFLIAGQWDDPETARKLAEDKFTLIAIFGLFGLLIATGLHFVVTGAWMVIFGRRNKHLVWMMWIFIAVVLFSGAYITVFMLD